MKDQLELNLQIAEMQLKAQPSTPLEIIEQRASTIAAGLEEIGGEVRDYTGMFKQALEVLTNLQEDPNIQCLEIEVHEYQQQYDSVKGTAQTVVLTQWLVRMQQAKALKDKVDTPRHKEVVLKEHVQPWIDTTFTITVNIEGNLIHIQGMHAQIQGSTLDIEVTEE